MSEVVSYERRGPVAWVRIERPEARNALSSAVREGLFEATHRFNADDDAKVLVLTGSGDRAFCAGADLKEMSASAMKVPPADFIPIFGRNIDVAKPTIAAVNGVAFAGGFLLTQMCDLCVASSTASFGITEARVGRGAPWAAPLPWLLSPRVAMQMLLTAEPISAQRAFELGLVNELAEPEQLEERTQALAETIARNAPLSVRAGKATVYLSLAADYERAEALWEPVYLSEDAQEGPRAFAERREPRWQGR